MPPDPPPGTLPPGPPLGAPISKIMGLLRSRPKYSLPRLINHMTMTSCKPHPHSITLIIHNNRSRPTRLTHNGTRFLHQLRVITGHDPFTHAYQSRSHVPTLGYPIICNYRPSINFDSLITASHPHPHSITLIIHNRRSHIPKS